MPIQSQITVRTCRLLYYGAPGAGKRENLRQIMESIPAEHRLSMAAEDPERQVAFRLRNCEQGEWNVLVQAVDAGREKYRFAGSQQALPFDGIIFVVNSASTMLDTSLSTLEGLKTYLDTWGGDLMSTPVVLQYNQCGNQEIISVDRLESLLNPWGPLSFPANSAQGDGVKETLKAILSLTISNLLQNPIAGQPENMNTAGFDSGPPIQGTSSMPDGTSLQQVPPPDVSQQTPTSAPAPTDDPSAPQAPTTQMPPPSESPTSEQSTACGQPSQIEISVNQGNPPSGDSPPPIVIPVRIPRHLLDSNAKTRIILEIQVED